MQKNKTLSIVMWSLWGILDLILLIFALPAGIILTIIMLIVFFVGRSTRKNRDYLLAQGVPADHKATAYYQGYDAPLNGPLLFWTTPDALHLCESRPQKKSGNLNKITILKNNIITFTEIGNVETQTNISGGGPSIGGALVGGAVAGAAGAVIGGRKKVKTQTTTTDNRRTVLKFTEGGTEKAIQLGYEIYDPLCLFCLEKKI
jgi:hypothetical protein